MQSGFCRLERGFTALDFGTADKTLLLQISKSLQVGGGQVALGARCSHLRLSSLATQCEIACIESREQLSGLHPLSHFCRALDELAPHPEAQTRLQLCPHLSRVLGVCAQGIGLYRHQLDRSDGLLQGRPVRTGSHGQRTGHDQDKMACSHGWSL